MVTSLVVVILGRARQTQGLCLEALVSQLVDK